MVDDSRVLSTRRLQGRGLVLPRPLRHPADGARGVGGGATFGVEGHATMDRLAAVRGQAASLERLAYPLASPIVASPTSRKAPGTCDSLVSLSLERREHERNRFASRRMVLPPGKKGRWK